LTKRYDVRYAKGVTMKKKRNYDKKVRLTRILLADYLALKQISQLAGISMAEALHKLIENPAQLPMLDRLAKPIPVIVAKPIPVLSVTPQPVITTNGNRASVFVIKPKGGVIND